MTDSQIINYLRENKYQKAVSGLYKVFPAIKKYIRANGGNTDDAKDIFQDALVVLYQKLQSAGFDLTVSPGTYLQAVVKNLWLSELRRRKKLPAVTELTDVPEDQVTEEPGFHFAKAAFDLLGEKCRKLLILFYFKKKNFKEIAAALAFNGERTAKNQKYRCLQKAKENYLTLSNSSHE